MDQHERNAQGADLLRELGEQVEALTSSSKWRQWLDVAARLHEYSFGNQMLIASQRPDATKVAGYRTWQSLGRQVRKGERGIKIFAPMAVKDRDAKDDANSVRILFRVVHVFDIAQTDGEPLAEIGSRVVERNRVPQHGSRCLHPPRGRRVSRRGGALTRASDGPYRGTYEAAYW